MRRLQLGVEKSKFVDQLDGELIAGTLHRGEGVDPAKEPFGTQLLRPRIRLSIPLLSAVL